MTERWEEIRDELGQVALAACSKDDYVSALHLRTLEAACKRIVELERERDALAEEAVKAFGAGQDARQAQNEGRIAELEAERERCEARVDASNHAADAEQVRRERNLYHDALIARHGGEPVALLEELDAARERIADLETALEESRQLQHRLATSAAARNEFLWRVCDAMEAADGR